MTQSDAPSPPPIPPASPPSVAPTGGPDRFLLAIVAGTLLLVVVGVVVVFTLGRARSTAQPADPNSPAGVVYAYIEAIRAGDVDRARGYLTAQARADFDNRTRNNPIRASSDERVRIVVETVSATDTAAEVKVAISHFYARSDPFSSGTSHRDVTARLVREGDTWKLSQPPPEYELS